MNLATKNRLADDSRCGYFNGSAMPALRPVTLEGLIGKLTFEFGGRRPGAASASRQAALLFDHLVSAERKCWRDVQPKNRWFHRWRRRYRARGLARFEVLARVVLSATGEAERIAAIDEVNAVLSVLERDDIVTRA